MLPAEAPPITQRTASSCSFFLLKTKSYPKKNLHPGRKFWDLSSSSLETSRVQHRLLLGVFSHAIE